jgi:hypothetical protein
VALQSACEAIPAVDYLPASSIWEGQLPLVVVVGGELPVEVSTLDL